MKWAGLGVVEVEVLAVAVGVVELGVVEEVGGESS
jgi:hypothetical protein